MYKVVDDGKALDLFVGEKIKACFWMYGVKCCLTSGTWIRPRESVLVTVRKSLYHDDLQELRVYPDRDVDEDECFLFLVKYQYTQELYETIQEFCRKSMEELA